MPQPSPKSFFGFSQLFVDINYNDQKQTDFFSDSFLLPGLKEDEKIAITINKNCMGASVSWKFNEQHEHKFVINKHVQPYTAQKQAQEEDRFSLLNKKAVSTILCKYRTTGFRLILESCFQI